MRDDSVGKSPLDTLGASFPALFPAEQATSSITAAPAAAESIRPRYYSPDSTFSFDPPPGFRFTEIPADMGMLVLAEGSAGESFQIFIIPFDEPGPLTPERIKRDLPKKLIQNPRTGTLDGTKVIVFLSREGSEEVLEVWFVHSGSLYQITAKTGFADVLQSILQTWRFTQ